MVRLAKHYGRYGYRKIAELLRIEGWEVNHKKWENGYNERFNGTLRREVLNAEWFTSIKQAQIVIETWLRQYNHIRPHQSLNMRPPVPETLSGNGT